MKVNQVPSTQEEEGTEVLQEEEEEAIMKPAAEGTRIPYNTRPSQSTIQPHYHKPRPPQSITTKIYYFFFRRQYTHYEQQPANNPGQNINLRAIDFSD